ncbi:hypothetical protein JCM15579A_27130 [Marinifilum fragile]
MFQLHMEHTYFFFIFTLKLATDAGSHSGIKTIPYFAAKVQFFVILFIKSTKKPNESES